MERRRRFIARAYARSRAAGSESGRRSEDVDLTGPRRHQDAAAGDLFGAAERCGQAEAGEWRGGQIGGFALCSIDLERFTAAHEHGVAFFVDGGATPQSTCPTHGEWMRFFEVQVVA